MCYFLGQGHSKGSYDQNMTVSTISSELLTSWQPNLVPKIHHYEPECFLEKKGLLHSRSRSLWLVKMSMFVQMISSKCLNVLLLNLVLWCIIMSQSACRKIGLLFSRLRSQQGLIWSKYDSFYYIVWTADSFATKLGLIVHYYTPECHIEKLDFCVQGQGHSKMSKC